MKPITNNVAQTPFQRPFFFLKVNYMHNMCNSTQKPAILLKYDANLLVLFFLWDIIH